MQQNDTVKAFMEALPQTPKYKTHHHLSVVIQSCDPFY